MLNQLEIDFLRAFSVDEVKDGTLQAVSLEIALK